MRDYLIGALVVVAGCAPTVSSTRFAEYPPRAEDHPVRVFAEQRPSCPYEEVGQIEVRKRYAVQSMEDVLAKMRDEARKMGADALVGVTDQLESQGGMAVPTEYGWMYGDASMDGARALAIRFEGSDCTN